MTRRKPPKHSEPDRVARGLRRVVSLRLSDEALARLDALAEEHGVGRGEVIERLLVGVPDELDTLRARVAALEVKLAPPGGG